MNMYKLKVISIVILFLLCFSSIVSAETWSDTWELTYSEESVTHYEQMDEVWYTTLNFSSMISVTGNTAPTISYPNPANESWGILVTQYDWNCTIQDPEGDLFNWTIQSAIGVNSSLNCINGSFDMTIFGNLSTGQTYYVWVNVSDGILNNNASFLFHTENASTFNSYVVLNFSDMIYVTETTTNVTINGSAGEEEMNVTLFGYMTNTSGLSTTAWFQVDNNVDFGSLTINTSNGTIAEGELFYKNVTNIDNGTYYYARTAINNSLGWKYSWNYTTFMTKPQPATALTTSNIPSGFNITWTHGNGFNKSWLVYNKYNVPTDTGNGTTIYVGTNDFYHHTDLASGQIYYYRIWEYADLYDLNQLSDGDVNTSAFYNSEAPILSNPNPTNGSQYVSITSTTWNITITTPTGIPFNWTIQGNGTLGKNASLACENGSYNITITGNLTDYVVYTVWVNATTNNLNWTNETFWFQTSQLNFSYFTCLNFSDMINIQGTAPVISNIQPVNMSFNNYMYPWLNITVTDPQSGPMNVTWYYDIGSGWVKFAYNTTASGGTVRQRAIWVNNTFTKYNWSVHVNDSDMYWTNATYYFYTANYTWGNWSSWWSFNYTCCCPTNFVATAYNTTVINLTWSNCYSNGCDVNYLVVNETGWANFPYVPSNGTLLYNGTNQTYNHTGLAKGVVYYYTIWGYNNTNNNYSIINYTDSEATQGDLDICCPYPANQSTEVTRPPVNLSAIVNGTNLEVYVYFYNMTPTVDLWTLLYNHSGTTGTRFSVNELTTNNATTQFQWGNTNYTWSVNITDGTNWLNRTYWYNTLSTASGVCARNDTFNDNTVNVFDLNVAWTYRSAGTYPYDGMYDVYYDLTINVFDLNRIWTGKS